MRHKHYLAHTLAGLQDLKCLDGLRHWHNLGRLGCSNNTLCPELHSILNKLLKQERTIFHHRDQVDTGHGHILQVWPKLNTAILLCVFLAYFDEPTEWCEKIPGPAQRLVKLAE